MDPIKAERSRRGPSKSDSGNTSVSQAFPPSLDGQLESTQAATNAATTQELIRGAEIAGAGRLVGLDDDETMELVSRTYG